MGKKPPRRQARQVRQEKKLRVPHVLSQRALVGGHAVACPYKNWRRDAQRGVRYVRRISISGLVVDNDISLEPAFRSDIAERLREFQRERPLLIPADQVMRELGLDD